MADLISDKPAALYKDVAWAAAAVLTHPIRHMRHRLRQRLSPLNPLNPDNQFIAPDIDKNNAVKNPPLSHFEQLKPALTQVAQGFGVLSGAILSDQLARTFLDADDKTGGHVFFAVSLAGVLADDIRQQMHLKQDARQRTTKFFDALQSGGLDVLHDRQWNNLIHDGTKFPDLVTQKRVDLLKSVIPANTEDSNAEGWWNHHGRTYPKAVIALYTLHSCSTTLLGDPIRRFEIKLRPSAPQLNA